MIALERSPFDACCQAAGVPASCCGAGRVGDQPVAKIASDLGISESCLRRWMSVDDVDAGRKEGLTSSERKELVELRGRNRVQAMEIEILKRARLLRPGERPHKRLTPLGHELAADGPPVAVTCRVLNLSRLTYYDAASRRPSARAVADMVLTSSIRAVHEMSRGSYGAPRVHAEMRLGQGLQIGRKRVAGLMKAPVCKGSVIAASVAAPARSRRPRRPGQAGLRRRLPGPALGHRRHRAPHEHRQGLLLRRHRHLLPNARGLVDRRPHPR